MRNFEINKSQVPLWQGAEGKLIVRTDLPESGSDILTPGDGPILDASWSLTAGHDFSFGGAGTVKLGLTAETSARFVPLWKEDFAGAAKLVDDLELRGHLTEDNVLLSCQFGARADLEVEGAYKYSFLSASASLKAGGDASYAYVRAFPRATGLQEMLVTSLGAMQLPAQVDRPLQPGEVIAFEYGGYLNFAASVSAGYDVKGTHSLEISELKLTEKYALSVVGSLGISAAVAGRYRIEVRTGATDDWLRVAVKRSRSREFGVAADLKVNASLVSEGLPKSGKEFLGTLIGVNGKNWLNLIDSAAGDAASITDINALKSRLDSLAASFIERYAGQAIDQFDSAGLNQLLSRLNQAVASYRNLDQNVISLVDRYLDPVADRLDELNAHLDTLARLTSWDQLRGSVHPLLWNAVQQLTGGDPLNWILDQTAGPNATLDKLKERVASTKSILSGQAHQEVLALLKLAKSEFGIDHFFSLLDSIKTPEELKTNLSKAAKGFVERLIGRAVDALDGRGLKKAFELVKEVAGKRTRFWDTFDHILEEAASQKASLAITGAYKSASEEKALIDVEVRLRKDGQPFLAGQRMFRAAANGDFRELLGTIQPEVVRIGNGLFTSRLSSETSLKINIAGWHREFQYSSLFRVVTESSQQIRTSTNGAITVFTQIDMNASSEHRRKTTKSEEKMTTNFLLRYLGETKGLLLDPALKEHELEYLVEVITGQTASYETTFTDSHTSRQELLDYFSFARVLGLDVNGATAAAVLPLMRARGRDNFGAVRGEYEVHFTPEGLNQLFAANVTEAQVRTILRRIVLANYIGKGNIADVAVLYASDRVRQLYREFGNNFINSDSPLKNALLDREVIPEPGLLPGVKLPAVSNRHEIRLLTANLLDTEDDLLAAFLALRTLLTSGGTPIRLQEFEQRMQAFGNALNRFDKRDLGDNTTFAVIDGIIALNAGPLPQRGSAMSFGFTGTDDQPKQILFTAPVPQ